MSTNHRDIVQHYYDFNTKWFLRLGKNRKYKHIHQIIWGEGVKTADEAANYTIRQVLERLKTLSFTPPLHVLDLGCGVGGAMAYLLNHANFPLQIDGITISQQQVALARKFLSKKHPTDTFTILEGDFLRFPFSKKTYHLTYAIESFIHASSGPAFFRQVAPALKRGGYLILVDDFINDKYTQQPDANKWLSRFKKGWVAPSLAPLDEVVRYAEENGLRVVENHDLTPFLKLGRPRDKLIGSLYQILGDRMFQHPYLSSLAGGYAKQKCLINNWVQYRFVVFEKTDHA